MLGLFILILFEHKGEGSSVEHQVQQIQLPCEAKWAISVLCPVSFKYLQNSENKQYHGKILQKMRDRWHAQRNFQAFANFWQGVQWAPPFIWRGVTLNSDSVWGRKTKPSYRPWIMVILIGTGVANITPFNWALPFPEYFSPCASLGYPPITALPPLPTTSRPQKTALLTLNNCQPLVVTTAWPNKDWERTMILVMFYCWRLKLRAFVS